jgi:hypothetical protein
MTKKLHVSKEQVYKGKSSLTVLDTTETLERRLLHPDGCLCLWDTLEQSRKKKNGLRDNETRGERDRTAFGSGGAHQQLPVRETHR